MKFHCLYPDRRFAAIGASFVAVGVHDPNFLAPGLALLALAAMAQWRECRHR